MTYPFCIDFLPSWIVDGRSSRVDPWLVDRASSRPSPGIRFSTLLAALGTSRTSGPPIATRDPPDPSDRPSSPRIRAYRFVSYRPAASDRSRALSQPDIVSVWKIA
ncbi:hypothetical protein QLX08_009510 [Tetragonisca angustula]|uniref:Uncharacterized protein n=1 Tax=Tetragonisca angustula TaxID=166442 RepID=A0AAW0ZGR4_9HYME